jgi:ribosome biogenesis GTPase
LPKYRGGSDDWLDDENDRRSKKLKSTDAKDLAVPHEKTNGTVAEVFPKQARVRWDDGTGEYLCAYRRATVFARTSEGLRERAPVSVGDRVQGQKTGTKSGLIEGVGVRRNSLYRSAPDRGETLIHVLVSNIDRLVIVTSAKTPDFSPGIVDRFLIAAQRQEIETTLVVNKLDLCTPAERREGVWNLYRKTGVDVIETCAKSELAGLEELRSVVEGQQVAFCGHSGVGKTSLLTALLGSQEGGRVAEVNAWTGKGRHTTTSAVLLPGTRWIDTPGVREFGLGKMDPLSLVDYFPELQGLKCQQSPCFHLKEPGCAARDQVRHPSYLRIYESVLKGEG